MAENEKPKGKFDLSTPAPIADDWQDEPVNDWQDEAPPAESSWVDELKVDPSKIGHSIVEGVKHPLETTDDFVKSALHGNILETPLQKGVAAIEAGAEEVGDLFRPEDKRRDFKDRMMERFKIMKEAEDEKQAEREARSPFAARQGHATGSLVSSFALPFSKATGATGAAIRTGQAGASSAVMSGLESKDEPFSLDRANEGAGWGAGIQGAFEVAPPLIRGTGRLGRGMMERMTKTPPQVTEQYWNRPEQVMSGPSHEELAANVSEGVGKLKKDVIAGSNAATKQIPSDLEIPHSAIEPELNKIHQQIKGDAVEKSHIRAANEIGNLNRNILGKPKLSEVKFSKTENLLQKLEDPLENMNEKEVMQLHGGRMGLGEPKANINFDSIDHDDAVNWYYAHRIDDILKNGKKKVEELSPKDRRLYDANIQRIEQHALLRDFLQEKEALSRNLTEAKTSSGKQIPATSYKLEALDYSPKDFEEAAVYYENLKNEALGKRPNDAMRFEQPEAYKRFIENSKDEAKQYEDMAKRLMAASKEPQMTKDQFAVKRIIEQRLRDARIGKGNYRDDSEKLLTNLKETLGGGPMITDEFIDDTFKEAIAKRPPEAVAESRAARERAKLQTIEGGGETSEATINGRKIKAILKQLDTSTKVAKGKGEFASPENASKMQIRSLLDQLLKGNEGKGIPPPAPGYKEAMVPVARKTNLLSKVKVLGKEDTAAKRLPSLASSPGRNPEMIRNLKALDKELGTDFYNQNLDANARKHFDKSLIGGGGNRTAIGGALVGTTLGAIFGDLLGASGGGTLGWLAGTAIDGYLPSLNKFAIDGARFAYNKGGRQLGQFAGALEAAAKKGPVTLGLVHLILLDKSPEYEKLVNDNQIREAQAEALKEREAQSIP